MAYVSFPNGLGITVMPFGYFPTAFANATPVTLNAAGESIGMLGRINLSSGAGTSKTISSAGGKIYYLAGINTWVTAGSTLRIGIQDINPATGIEDGTYDVYDDLVQGTDTIANSATKEVIMSSGSKTITDGDLIAVVIEMTVRNVADSIQVVYPNYISNYPYITTDTGTGPTKTNFAGFVAIVFDDGTLGYFDTSTIPFVDTVQSYQSGASPDEYGIIFQLPFKCKINALCARLGDIDLGDEGTLNLISTPLTTPTDMLTVAVTSAYSGSSSVSTGTSVHLITETELLANTDYAITYRPTVNIVRGLVIFTLGHADLRKGMLLGTNLRGGTRTDLGAFTVSTTVIPDIGFRISKLDDGTSTVIEAGESSFAFVG